MITDTEISEIEIVGICVKIKIRYLYLRLNNSIISSTHINHSFFLSISADPLGILNFFISYLLSYFSLIAKP